MSVTVIGTEQQEKPWWKSKIMLSGLATFLISAVQLLTGTGVIEGLGFPADYAPYIRNWLSLIGALVGIAVMVFRSNKGPSD